MPFRLALFAAVVPLLLAACGGTGDARHVLVYEKPVTFDGWGWIWRAAPGGSHPHKLVLGYDPSVSPDARWIAYRHANSLRKVASLWIISSKGGTPRKIGHDERWISILGWAPDSKHLLISDNAGLENVDAVRGTETLLVRTSRTVGVYSASYSPDSHRVVYERGVRDGSDIFVVPASGGQSRRLTHDLRSVAPLWGPTAIAYCRCNGNSSGDIWLMAPDGAQQRRLTHDNEALNPAAWSRDGRRLLAAYPAMHNGKLWAVDASSGRVKALTRWVGDLYAQGLSPDGHTVYAALGCGGMISPFGELETMPFAGGPAKVIVRGPCRGSWSR